MAKLGIDKINVMQCYSNDQIKQARKNIKDSGRRIQKQRDDDFVNPDIPDWHKPVTTVFHTLFQVQQFLSGMKWIFIIDGKTQTQSFQFFANHCGYG